MSNSADIKTIIREQLPSILAEDASIRNFILRTVSDYYSPKQETDQKFEEFKERVDRILDELQRDREEQALKWQENNRQWNEQKRLWDEQKQLWQENNRRLDKFIHEQNQKWDKQYQQNQETLAEIKQMNRKHR